MSIGARTRVCTVIFIAVSGGDENQENKVNADNMQSICDGWFFASESKQISEKDQKAQEGSQATLVVVGGSILFRFVPFFC